MKNHIGSLIIAGAIIIAALIGLVAVTQYNATQSAIEKSRSGDRAMSWLHSR
jgi:hypothetical protein